MSHQSLTTVVDIENSYRCDMCGKMPVPPENIPELVDTGCMAMTL
jgi:hypothetical protein